jgi:hypothetical protein
VELTIIGKHGRERDGLGKGQIPREQMGMAVEVAVVGMVEVEVEEETAFPVREDVEKAQGKEGSKLRHLIQTSLSSGVAEAVVRLPPLGLTVEQMVQMVAA